MLSVIEGMAVLFTLEVMNLYGSSPHVAVYHLC